MNAPRDSYWSIEDCAWVRSPARSVDLPEPRDAEQVDAVGAATGGVAASVPLSEPFSDVTA